MADQTRIEWADATWNPIVGCSKCSPGCANCYAERMAVRLAAMGKQGYRDVVADGRWNGHVAVVPGAHLTLTRWRKPRRVFVGSMSDVFHPAARRAGWNRYVFQPMLAAPQHTYMLLTKRSRIMRDVADLFDLPQNVWCGVTVCNQTEAFMHLPELVESRTHHRYVSYEPALAPVDLTPWLGHLDLVIAGGETGPGARPAETDWFRQVRDQCVQAGVPFFFKRHGAGNKSRLLDGREWNGECE